LCSAYQHPRSAVAPLRLEPNLWPYLPAVSNHAAVVTDDALSSRDFIEPRDHGDAPCGVGGVVAMDRAWVRSCRFVTHAGNARSFPLCSLDIIIVAAAEAYAGFRVGDDSLNALLGSRHARLYP